MTTRDARIEAAWEWAKLNLPIEWILDKRMIVGILDAADQVLVGVEAELAAALRSIKDQEAMRVEISDLRSQIRRRDDVLMRVVSDGALRTLVDALDEDGCVRRVHASDASREALAHARSVLRNAQEWPRFDDGVSGESFAARLAVPPK